MPARRGEQSVRDALRGLAAAAAEMRIAWTPVSMTHDSSGTTIRRWTRPAMSECPTAAIDSSAAMPASVRTEAGRWIGRQRRSPRKCSDSSSIAVIRQA